VRPGQALLHHGSPSETAQVRLADTGHFAPVAPVQLAVDTSFE
jgi:hypothetical protein